MNKRNTELLNLYLEDKGDIKEIENELIKNNLKLVNYVIGRYFKVRADDLESVKQCGNIGLLKGFRRYKKRYNDHDDNLSYILVMHIRREIQNFYVEANETQSIRPSRADYYLLGKISRFMQNYERENKDQPSFEVIAKEFDLSVEKVKMLINTFKKPSFFDKSISEESNESDKNYGYNVLIHDDDFTQLSVDLMALKGALLELTPEEQQIIDLFYFKYMKQKEISELTGFDQGKVSRELKRIRNKLKNIMEGEY